MMSKCEPAARAWCNPLPLRLLATEDSRSFERMPANSTGLPQGEHPGAFGVVRAHHVHEGVDLYCPDGTSVFAVEDGIVVAVQPFTGVGANMPWWEDTTVILVEGACGVVAYGEVSSVVAPGQRVVAGQRLGEVVRVLKVDKGRPMSMLHLELHEAGSRSCPEWTVLGGRPTTLRDPTEFLLALASTDFE
jgi:murein DD-endopeptidase MepM/ murein hydrolase activator NlpD